MQVTSSNIKTRLGSFPRTSLFRSGIHGANNGVAWRAAGNISANSSVAWRAAGNISANNGVAWRAAGNISANSSVAWRAAGNISAKVTPGKSKSLLLYFCALNI